MMKINKKSNQMNINNNEFNIILKPHQKSLIPKSEKKTRTKPS